MAKRRSLRKLDEIKALQLLKERGYIVKRGTNYVKKTFEVDEEILVAFIRIREKLGIKLKEAVNSALKDWIEKYQ